MSVPILEAQSYKTDAVVVERQLVGMLTDQQSSIATHHSAANLKFQLRCSLNDISNDNHDDNENLSLNDGTVDCSNPSHSESTSWSMSENDLIRQGVDEDEDEVNLARDGSWGWVVVAASFVINLIADGTTFSFGVIYAELLDYFKEKKGYTAVIGSLFMAIPLLSGPLASSLTDRFGCRKVTIAGSILAALGLFLSSISNSVEALFLTFGLITGFGLSLCNVASIALVAFYFDKRLSLATGLAVCGSGIGTFILAPVTQFLIKEYMWRGAMLILSGLFFNICVCGALMRDIEGTSNRRGNGKGKISRSASAEQTSIGLQSRNCSERETEHQRLSSDSPAVLMENKAAADLNFLEIDTRLRNSLVNLPTFLSSRASSCPDIYRNSITMIARKKKGTYWDYLYELRQVFMFDFSYLSNPSFVMFAISNALLYCCYHVPYIYLTDLAKTQSQPKNDELLKEFVIHTPSGCMEEPSFLLSIVGILNTLGVIVMGYLGDRSWVNPTWMYSASMLLCGLSTVIVPFLPGSPWLEMAAGLFGWSIAANYSLVSAILVELISLERFVNAYGLLLLFQGVANLIGPPLAGYICDSTGSYDLSFYIAGIIIIFSGAIPVMLPAFQHLKSRMAAHVGRNSLETTMLAKEEN